VQGIAYIKNSRGERSSMVGLVEFFAICLSHSNFSFDKDPLGSKHRGTQKDIVKNIDIKQLKIKTHFFERKNGALVVKS
jgi:hypothetical protein